MFTTKDIRTYYFGEGKDEGMLTQREPDHHLGRSGLLRREQLSHVPARCWQIHKLFHSNVCTIIASELSYYLVLKLNYTIFSSLIILCTLYLENTVLFIYPESVDMLYSNILKVLLYLNNLLVWTLCCIY
jgi:hypothetical protein